MIENIVKDYLSQKFEEGVYLDVPDNIPSFILIEKVGGEEGWLNYANIAIQSYGSRREIAMLLNERVKTVMADIIDLDCVVECALEQDQNFTDTSTKQYRYQAVFNITYY